MWFRGSKEVFGHKKRIFQNQTKNDIAIINVGDSDSVSITHDISEAVASDKVIIMNKGEVYAVGTPKEIFSDEEKLVKVGLQLPFTYKLQHELIKSGYSFNLVMSTKEMVNEICQLNFKK
mgnify:CR=1 FL=1